MSSYLWQAFYNDSIDAFERHLEAAAHNVRHANVGRGGLSQGVGALVGSPEYSSSPSTPGRSRKFHTPKTPNVGIFVLSKADINGRDPVGMTLLHHAASSMSDNAVAFATALVEHPYIDLYIQDLENGWTALHRAFYFGNITIARLILERDNGSIFGSKQVNQLLKIKDREGLGPLDLYAATIKDRTLRPAEAGRRRSNSNASDEDATGSDGDEAPTARKMIPFTEIGGDQLFSFGSGNNNNLGLGDQDDRAFPERVNLKRPEHLLKRFYKEFLAQRDAKWSLHDPAYHRDAIDIRGMWVEDMPWVVRSRPLVIQDVFMSKLHSAVLTTDPVSNLYMCGHGPGGRLGTGDERTRFQYVCIEAGGLSGKRIATVALGQNHTLALDEAGEIFSWGNNGYGQLGYSLPKTSGDEDPLSTVPRQIFGPLKREAVQGIAASRFHSVAHTSTSLFTFGKNEGQLGIVDSDARSLECQVTPRKVAASLFSSPICEVAAIDRATICLLENHDVWVFANYGYAKIQFPLDGFSNYFLKQSFLVTTYDAAPNRVVKITAEGDTICAMSSRGEIFTVSISQRSEDKSSVSTTNPAKIRSAISQPQRIWSPKKSNMAARDVDLDVDGSIILSTHEGSVWKRTRRAKIKDATAVAATEYRAKDYKFSRIPGLTRVLAVRASGSGAYSALRYDCDVLRKQIVIEDPSLWKDLFQLFSLAGLGDSEPSDDEETRPRFWQGSKRHDQLAAVKKAVLRSVDIDADLASYFEHAMASSDTKYDAFLATTSSKVQIPLHRFMLTARSRVLRRGFRDLCEASTFTIPDLCQSEIDDGGRLVITFHGMDLLTMVDLAMYLYTDDLVPFWNFTRAAPKMAYSYRQVRAELMKISSKLEMRALEPAVRQMVTPRACLNMDLELAYADPAFFHDADVVVELAEDENVKVHSTLVCARCPFFEGLFMGRSRGAWIAGRSDADIIKVDLKHVSLKTFEIVLRHIYCDTGAEIFDDIVSTDVDDFLDTVTDVLSCANELMLDRLSQIAQSVAGQCVNARNVCGLLNAISPSSVREFLDTGLEYLCLNLEAMLQGHHLNELDPDLLEELDEVVRANQLACMPFAKSGRAEMLLHERHPDLAGAIELNRRRRIDAIAHRSKYHDMAIFSPGSFGEDLSTSPMQQKTRRRSSQVPKVDDGRDQVHPALRAKASVKDMMFDMDDEHDSLSPRRSPAIRPLTSPRGVGTLYHNTPPEDTWFDSRGKALLSPKLAPQSTTPSANPPRTPKSPPLSAASGKPWSLTPLSGKVDLKDILEQTALNRTSTLTQGLASTAGPPQDIPAPFALPAPRMSQKERKRMQQAQQQGEASISPAARIDAEPTKPFSWQAVSAQKRPTVNNLMGSETSAPGGFPSMRSSSTPQMTMRQTVANPKQTIDHVANQAGGTPDSHQASPSLRPRAGDRAKGSVSSAQSSSSSKPIPQSIRHQQTVEADWGLSMSEIVAQQQIEKDIVKEAVAKRNLQEIQAEQEFQEWWNKESARVQAAEQEATAPTKAPRKHRGRGGARSRGGKAAGQGSTKNGGGASSTAQLAEKR